MTYQHQPDHQAPYWIAYDPAMISRPIYGLGSISGVHAIEDGLRHWPHPLVAVPCTPELRHHVMAFGGAVRWRLRLDGVADLVDEEDDLCASA